MSLYLPRSFEEADLGRLDALAAAHPFATLVTTREGAPFASHLPLLYSRDGESILLEGHVSRANPQARHAGHALAMLQGPHAYVSPTWYPDKAEQARVPTWNYVVAHLSGEMETIADEAWLATHVDAMAALHEARAGGDWRFDVDDEAERSQLRGIVGLRLRVSTVEFKAKLSQNHPDANRRAVIARLAASDDAMARDVARLMADTLEH